MKNMEIKNIKPDPRLENPWNSLPVPSLPQSQHSEPSAIHEEPANPKSFPKGASVPSVSGRESIPINSLIRDELPVLSCRCGDSVNPGPAPAPAERSAVPRALLVSPTASSREWPWRAPFPGNGGVLESPISWEWPWRPHFPRNGKILEFPFSQELPWKFHIPGNGLGGLIFLGMERPWKSHFPRNGLGGPIPEVANLRIPEATNLGILEAANSGIPDVANSGIPKATTLGIPEAKTLGIPGPRNSG